MRQSSLSRGSLITIFTVSISTPRKTKVVVGFVIFSEAMGTTTSWQICLNTVRVA